MEGSQQDYGMRIYDPRLGRFLSVDPITKEYPELTPYQFASNRPIDGIDRDGLEYATFTIFVQDGKVKDITVVKDYELKSKYTLGPGVQLNYAYLDKNGKVEKFEAGPNVANSVYGIYGGDKNPRLPKIGKDPKDLYDDYSLDPLNEVDAGTKKHDLAFDNLTPKQIGLKGVMNDATTNANNDAISASEAVAEKYKKGEVDNITGKQISPEELMGAFKVYEGFKTAEGVKNIKNTPVRLIESTVNLLKDVKQKAIDGVNAVKNWTPNTN